VNSKMIRKSLILALAFLAGTTTAALAQVTQYVHFEQGGAAGWGVLEGETIHRLSDAPYLGGSRTGQTLALSAATLLPPASPKLVVIANVNFPSGVTGAPRDRPTLVTIPPRSLVGHGSPIMRPAEVDNLRAEPTVAVVIGRTATNVSPDEAAQYIFGVVPGIDVTAMDWRPAGSQWTRAKGTDTFKPLGPVLVSGVDYNNLTITARHNETALESVRTADMIWDFNELVSYISRYMTLSPGDVVFAGTAGENFTVALQAGETMEVEIPGVGTLRSPVAAAAPVAATLPPPFRQ
jgi:2-keto-4-pentenoate hydratase/2-oxohepta-3-ene-1,7-dioic acid hydratase in catechol pathway